MLSNNFIALILTFIIAIAWLRLMDFFAHRGWISSYFSRKIIHIGTGPIFVLCWLFFNEAPIARYLAALVPLAITTQFILVGLGVIRDQAAVEAMSRTGDRREILRGPLYYGIVFVLITALYWKDTPAGIIALMMVCGGDGLAELIGRKFGRKRLPWSKDKSWAGSVGMFVGGWSFSLLILGIFLSYGIFVGQLITYLLPLTIITLFATIVESLPLKDVDNITIALVSLLVGRILF